MSTPDALRLAARLDANLGDTRKPAAAELRRQHAEIERLRADYEGACKLVADMHAAATGRPGEGPRLGVVEDVAAVAAVAAEAERLRADAARYRWLLTDYARGDGYTAIDAALNDGEADTQLSPAIDAAMRDAL